MTEAKELTTLGTRSPMLSRDQVVKNRETVRDVMRGVMEKGKHYGVIPGTGDKPTLLKPGAEVLLSTFRIATSLVVEDLSDEDSVRYRVVVKGMHGPSGIDLGEGIGECSSNETKYKWRKASCVQEFEETDRDRRRLKWVTPNNGEPFALQQVRTEPSDQGNTVLKMAKKRALIDFTLTALAVSDMFSQDLEDLEAELHGGGDDGAPAGNAGGGGAKPATNRPTAKAEPAQQQQEATQQTAAKDAKPAGERKGSAGAAAAKAAASGASVPVVNWRQRLDRIGYPEAEFCAYFERAALEDFALKDVAAVEARLVDVERQQGGPK